MMDSFFLSTLTVLFICAPAAWSDRGPLRGMERRKIEEQLYSDLCVKIHQYDQN